MLTGGNKVAGQLDLSAPLITPLHMYTNPVQFNRHPVTGEMGTEY